MQNLNYTCPKCGNNQYEVDQLRGTGGFLSKIFDVQSKKFTTVICTRCQYTEMYRVSSSMLGNIFDPLLSDDNISSRLNDLSYHPLQHVCFTV